ncbi:A disintegrin and metalloproteinase with thrombospondin motifs 6-like [Elysia marginata]|uniref:A disintegrin and metalloproteinase with thrombospondin motifs 6-like n=1 Tax=Elysia marginata TaxID=1093978 RepID=A0AAV4EDE0_9GAST|nr:A disintegrin and metalloproteinase with thrombospondin motifs 6-like [Elysia marginata]
MLLQEENLGIEYQYNLPVNASDDGQHDISLYVWSHLVWSACSKSCSRGISTSKARCVLKSDGRAVDEKFCKRQPKPTDLIKHCNEDPCPPRWLVGQWSDCSKSCGVGGHRTRKVACVQQVGVSGEEESGNSSRLVVDDTDCSGQKPASERECRLKDCPPEWHTFEWSEAQLLRAVTTIFYPSHTFLLECEDKFRVAYCPLVLKFGYCRRTYFQTMCCKTCAGEVTAARRRRRKRARRTG